jgi:hypothetical protein
MAPQASAHAKVAVFNLRRLIGCLNSVAYARAATIGTSMQYQNFSESGVMNALISACTGQPGIADINQNTVAIEHQRKQFAKSYLQTALNKAHDDPSDFLAYLNHLEKVKEQNLAMLRQTFQQAAAVNSGIDHSLTIAIDVLAATKAASTIAIAVTPVGLTFAGAEASLIATASGVAFVYSIGKGIAKNLGEAKDVKVIAFDAGKDFAKEAGKEGISRVADKVKEHAAEKLAEHTDLITEAEQKIDELTVKLARKVSSKKIAKLNRQIGRAEEALSEAKTMASKARLTGIAASRGVPVVFAAMDIWEAIDDLQKDVGLKPQ